ncbi:carboxymuconolactone decarboxylase family protein [Pigmentiphaga litoralis]|uniref:carboxymuconolactone decarboxylase family protein n=1 Tax=Pigmentiphaga litoralis TaxID=516702 RepID=UPI003B429FC1
MARIPYVDETTHPELAPAIGRIRAERRGKLIPVYGLLLHSPAIAEEWLAFINAVRWKTQLGARLREIVILRVAVLNHAGYVVDVHRQHFTGQDGLDDAACDALLADTVVSDAFSPTELAVIAYVDALTREAQVPDAVFARLRPKFEVRQIVELSVLIGAYNMHTRVLNALQIDPE